MRLGMPASASMKKLTVEPVPTPMIGARLDVFERGCRGSLLLLVLAHRCCFPDP